MRRCVLSLSLAAAAAVTTAPPAAVAQGRDQPAAPAPAAEEASEARAKDAIERFQEEFKSEHPGVRTQAVKRLGAVVHPLVVNVLLDIALKDRDVPTRTAAFYGLALQTTSAKTLGPRLAKFVAEASEDNRKAKAKGDYGVRVDPKTGKTDVDSDDGKAALRAKRERGEMLAEATRALDATGYRDKESTEVIREFLNDGNDELVAVAMGMFGKWREWSVLPDLLDLYETYPFENKYVPGATHVDTGAAGGIDQAAAKRAWMAKYGDPDKRRARPVVVRALKSALFQITGEKFESPVLLREYLRRPEVKRKVKGK